MLHATPQAGDAETGVSVMLWPGTSFTRWNMLQPQFPLPTGRRRGNRRQCGIHGAGDGRRTGARGGARARGRQCAGAAAAGGPVRPRRQVARYSNLVISTNIMK